MILNLSDVHLLNREVPSEHMVESLRSFIPPDMWQRLTAIFISGDLFDRLVSAQDLVEQYPEVVDWLKEFLSNSKRYKVPIRMVKGTPSHDWNLCKWVLKIDELANIKTDIRYYDDVHLEYDESLKLWIAYIPDAIRPDPMMVYNELVEKMKTLGCDKIDYIIAHGFFDFQNTHDSPAYDTALFSDLVRYAIFCGHDHGNKSYLKVYIPGSFERLRQNEEHPKGALISQVVGDTHRVFFRENKNAANIRTVDFTELDDDQLLTRVSAEITKQHLTDAVYLGKLRVLVSGKTHLRTALQRLTRKTAFKLDIDYINDDTEVIEKREQNKKFTENLVPLLPGNIKDLLLDAVSCDTDIATKVIDKIQGAVK
ncbi:MAG: hypothetical protein ACRDDY_13955 [Clostridium sp.]